MAQRTRAERREDRREVRQAASDGNISRQEVRQLTNSGATERQINNVASRNDATVQRQQVNLMPSPRQASSGAGGGQGSVNAGFASDPILAFASGRDRSPEYNTLLSSNNQLGAFDGASWARAQNAGYSDQQIADSLNKYIDSGDKSLMIGKRPMSVLANWQNDNPNSYRDYAHGPAAEYSSPAQVMFNPLGEINIGLGRGGQQDQGITWYSTQGSAENDLSKSLMPKETALNTLENGYYQQTADGFNRMMQGESAAPNRYIGDMEGRPDQYGGYTYGYDTFNSPAAQQYNNNLNYSANWSMPKPGKARK
jgi:hypothetical protein